MNMHRLSFDSAMSMGSARLLSALCLVASLIPAAWSAPLGEPMSVALAGTVHVSAAAASQSSAAVASAAMESVSFSGVATVNARLLKDDQLGAPAVLELTVDLTGLSGVGVSTGRRYVTLAETVTQRPLRPVDTVQITFPFFPDGDLMKSRTAQATLRLLYDESSGLTVSAVVGTPSI